MDYYKQHSDVVVKQLSSNTQLGLDEDVIFPLRQKSGRNVLTAVNTRSIYRILWASLPARLLLF